MKTYLLVALPSLILCAAAGVVLVKMTLLKRFPPDLNRRDSQRVKDERIFVH